MSSERIAVLETRMNSTDKRVGGLEKSMYNMSEKIDEIHSVVVINQTNMGWVRKLMLIIIGLFVSGGAFYGYRTWSNGEAIAQKPAVQQVDE
jgi:hypothetical protein